MFPFNKHEPNGNSDELQCLDAIADAIKIKRLANHRCLRHACRFTCSLHTFCENMGGDTWWLRPTKLASSLMFGCKRVYLDGCRKRLLFSPASNAIMPRLLPTMCFEMMEHGDSSIDGKDAFFDGETTDTYHSQLPVACWADHSTRPRQSAPWSAWW